jgi:hypothetical protein
MAWVHKLSDIDPVRRTAVCQHCGPVSIRGKVRNGGVKGWRCSPGNPRTERQKTGLAKTTACERVGCAYGADHQVLLDLHHRDGNPDNNDPANLMTLCAFCHRLHHAGLLKLS